jgi:peptide/nickel transport system substrate-binding protein
VRRALLLGLNRQWIVDRILNGQAILADGPVLPGTWGYYDGMERVPFDPAAAIELLKQAGYTFPAEGGEVRTNADGVRLQFELVYPDDEQHEAIAALIQENWQKLGVGVEIVPQGYDILVGESLATRQYQAALVDLNLARSPDPDPYPFWHETQTQRGQNYSGWDDHQASEYLERARIIPDIGERAIEYRNFQVRFSQELPALPLYYPVYSFGVASQVQGVSVGPLFDPSDRHDTLAQWYLIARRATEAAPTASPEATVTP